MATVTGVLHGGRPEGAKRRAGTVAVDEVEWREADPENGFLKRRGVRVWTYMGKRREVACELTGCCDVAGVRYYRAKDADDGTLHVLDATDAATALDRAEESYAAAREAEAARLRKARQDLRAEAAVRPFRSMYMPATLALAGRGGRGGRGDPRGGLDVVLRVHVRRRRGRPQLRRRQGHDAVRAVPAVGARPLRPGPAARPP